MNKYTLSQKLSFFTVLLLLFSLPLLYQASSQNRLSYRDASAQAQSLNRVFYVSKGGNNTDGTSWETAWNELNQIKWDTIQPGDTIQIDGGPNACPQIDGDIYNDFDEGARKYRIEPHSNTFGCGVVYRTPLKPTKNGTSGNPISIMTSSEAGRNGTVSIFGGRTTALPYCQQSGYVWQTSGVNTIGIDLSGSSWITIDGGKLNGLKVYGHNLLGIKLSGSSNNITVRNIDIYDNGNTIEGGITPDQKGVDLSGSHITFEKAVIHDNGQDAFQSGGGLSNFKLLNSWLYFGRKNPVTGATFNYCRHPDGIQVYNGGRQSGVLIEGTLIGPGFMQGINLGAPTHTVGSRVQWATVDNVTIKNSLFYGSHNSNITDLYQYDNAPEPDKRPDNWRLENFTSYRVYDTNTSSPSCTAPEKNQNIYITGDSGYVVKNSVFYGGCFLDIKHYTSSNPIPSEGGNNCVYGMRIAAGNNKIDSVVADPQFTNISQNDYTVNSSQCVGKGSSVTSPYHFVALNTSSEPTSVPLPTASPENPSPTSFLPSPTTTVNPTSIPMPTPTTAVPPQSMQFSSQGYATPATVTRGSSTTVTANVTSATSINANVTVNVYNTAGTLIHMQLFSNQSFTAQSTRTFQTTWSTTAATASGPYTIKIGVSAPDWSKNYHWNNNAGTVVVAAPTPTSTPSPTPTRTPVKVTGYYSPSADTFVRSEFPDSNYGSNTKMNVKGSSTKLTYMKFDLSALAGKQVTKATLRFKTVDFQPAPSTTYSIRGVTNSSWGESTLNYNNRPAIGSAITSFSQVVQNGWKDVDITSTVQSSAGSLFSLAINNSLNSSEIAINTKESADKPILVVEYITYQ